MKAEKQLQEAYHYDYQYDELFALWQRQRQRRAILQRLRRAFWFSTDHPTTRYRDQENGTTKITKNTKDKTETKPNKN